jgi:fermentation-respiration switch protein FrsA (DUF1100 family)
MHVIAVAIGVYAFVIGGMYVFQRTLLYLPSTSIPEPARSGVPEMQPVELQTDDGLTLTAWFHAPTDGLPTVILFGGNAGNIGDRGFKARPMLDAGYGVLLVGYRGYGGNPGSPSEEGLYMDGRAALAFVSGNGIDAKRTVLYGESLGSGVAVHLAREAAVAGSPVAGLVLEAPYTSIADVAGSHYPFVPAAFLVKDRFDSVDKIAHVDAPIVVIHGERDRVVPTRFGRRLYETAVEPKESHWISAANHNDLYEFGLFEIVLEFLSRFDGGRKKGAD